MVEYANVNQGIKPDSHNCLVQYMQCDLNNTFQGRDPSVPVLEFSCALPNQFLQFQGSLQAWNMISTCSKRCKNTEQLILCPPAEEDAMVFPAKYNNPIGSTDCLHRSIQIVQQTEKMYIVPVRASIGPAYLVCANSASTRIDSDGL